MSTFPLPFSTPFFRPTHHRSPWVTRSPPSQQKARPNFPFAPKPAAARAPWREAQAWLEKMEDFAPKG